MSCNCANNCHDAFCPQYLQAVTTPCNEPGCDQQLTTDCVIYTGPDIPCLGLTTGMQLTEILLSILYDLHPECNPITTTTTTSTTTTTTAAPLPLRLLYSDINNSYIADPENVNDWNDGFNLPDYGTPFTSVVVDGNEVFLYGGSNITLWYDIFGDVDAILEIDDQAGCITSLTNGCLEYGHKTYVSLPECTIAGNNVFYANDEITYLNMPKLEYAGESAFGFCEILTTFNFPALKFVGNYCFANCYAMTSMYIPECIFIGPNPGDDGVFGGIGFNNITLTISTVASIIYYGGVDDDVAALQANNTVTLNIV